MGTILNSLIILLLGFGSTVLCVLLLKPAASRLGLVDHPSGRKNHIGRIPLVGGIAIWIAFSLTLLIAGLTDKLVYLLVASGLVVVVGAADDVIEISPTLRLALHIVAALVVCVMGGVVVQTLGDLVISGSEIRLGLFAIPFTVFAIVALVNATNMADGIDGLCSMNVIIPLAGLAVLAAILGDYAHLTPLMAICGCVAGFLVFNLRTPWRERASVFLGDAGSNLLGIVLAWFLIDMSQGQGAVLAPAAVLWFAILLIYDTVEVVARRLIRGKNPFIADREHLHHVFLLANFSVTETVFTMSGITLIGVFVGVGTAFIEVPDSALFGVFILIGLIFLRMILRTWSAMQFLYRSICRRQGERRQSEGDWPHEERRRGGDRRRRT